MAVKLHEGQLKFLTDKPKARIRLAAAGRQGGKTFVGAIAFRHLVEQYPGDSFIVVAPNFSMMALSTEPTLEMIFDRGQIVHKDRIRNTWYHANGAKIFLRTATDPDTLRGLTGRAAWLDEARQMPKLVYDIITPTLAVLKGFLLITTTPIRGGWLRKEIYLRRDSEDVLFVTWPSRLNPNFGDEEYERLKLVNDPRWFAQEYEGQFVGIGGLVYPQFEPKIHVDKEKAEFKKELPVYWGVDWGIANPTYISFWQINPDINIHKGGFITQFDELWRQGQPLGQVIDEALSKYPKKPTWVACDPSGRNRQLIAGYSAVDLLKREYGLSVKYKKNWNNAMMRMSGINKMHEALNLQNIAFHPRCHHMITSFELYSYDEPTDTGNKPIYDVPAKDGQSDHPMESSQYFMLCRPIHTLNDDYKDEWLPDDPWTGFGA